MLGGSGQSRLQPAQVTGHLGGSSNMQARRTETICKCLYSIKGALGFSVFDFSHFFSPVFRCLVSVAVFPLFSI